MRSTARPVETPAAPYAVLLRALGVVERRLRRQDAVQGAPLAVGVALALATVLAVAARLTPILPPVEAAGVAALLLIVAVCARTGYALLRARPRLGVARRADALLVLDEKVATAVEAHDRPRPGEAPMLRAAQLADARTSLERALPDLPARVPLAPGRTALLLPVLLLAAFGAALLAPNPLQGYWDQQNAIRQQQQAEAAKIEQLRKDLAARPGANDPAKQELLAQLDQLHHDLQAGNLSRDQAMARLSDAEAGLQKQIDPRAPGEQAAMDALAQRLADQPGALGEAGKALQRGDSQEAAKDLKQAGAD